MAEVASLIVLGGGIASLVYKYNYEPSEDEYDVIVIISSLKDLSSSGWPVIIPGLKPKQIEIDPIQNAPPPPEGITGTTVAVIGLYNKGKTHILSKLCGINLKRGLYVHTEGISMKIPRNELGSNFILLDTAGSQKPVKGNDNESRLDRKATESFLQELIMHLSNAILIVVNRLTLDDQIYIEHKKKKLRGTREFQNLIVIHNLVHVSQEDELNKVLKEEIEECCGCSRKEYIHNISGQETRKIPYYVHADGTRHVYICEDNTVAGKKHNASSYILLRNWLQAISTQNKKQLELLNEIEKFANNKLSNYFTTAVSVAIADGRVYKTSTKDLQYKQMSYTEVGTVEAKTSEGGDFPVKVDFSESSTDFQIAIDLPGPSENEVDVLVQDETHLTFKSRRVRPESYAQRTMLQSEREFGDVERTFTFPNPISEDDATEELKNGVYTLTIRKKRGQRRLGVKKISDTEKS